MTAAEAFGDLSERSCGRTADQFVILGRPAAECIGERADGFDGARLPKSDGRGGANLKVAVVL